MPVIFDLGPFFHGETQPSENMYDLVAHERDGVMGTQGRGSPGRLRSMPGSSVAARRMHDLSIPRILFRPIA